MALLAIPIWITTNNPNASILWVLVVEVIGTLPAIRKAWYLPYEEGVAGLVLNATSNIFALLALNHYSFAVVTYFITWTLLLGALATVAVCGRECVTPPIQSAF
jgi:hypothetical protein